MPRADTFPAKVILLPGCDGTGELFFPLLAALPREYSSIVVRYGPERVLGEYVESIEHWRSSDPFLPPRLPIA